jgi:hypothetical protein
MITKRTTKFILGACLLFGVLGCLGVKVTEEANDNSSGQLPRRKLDIAIDTSQRQILFDQLQKFAEKHDFMIQIDVQPSSPEDFLVYMTREDIIISCANIFAPGEYRLGVYDADRQQPVSDSVLDDLVNDLKSLVSEIPGTTFSVEK